MLLLLIFFSSSSDVHKEKKSQFIYNRETYRKENHRWNNDVYCSIENRRYTNIYIYRKRHETVLQRYTQKERKTRAMNQINEQTTDQLIVKQ